jgi:hypothetical protein
MAELITSKEDDEYTQKVEVINIDQVQEGLKAQEQTSEQLQKGPSPMPTHLAEAAFGQDTNSIGTFGFSGNQSLCSGKLF